MGDIDVGLRSVFRSEGGQSAPVIYVVDSPEHPFDREPLAKGRSCTIVTIPVPEWNRTLSPWPAAGLYREEPDFGGQAPSTLAELVGSLPLIEAAEGLTPVARAICGYSLGGLFSLYALTHCDAFAACACVSGSVWYEGWVEHLRSLGLSLEGRFAFLSVGTKEKRGGTPLMRTVQDRMEACSTILESHGCEVQYVTGPGNHLQFIPERLDTAITALDGFLVRAAGPSSVGG